MVQDNNFVLLSSAYLAPVQYYTKLVAYREVWIELSEHYLKQSYRNRCTILTANGVQNLSIPVAEGSNSKRIIRDVTISYDHPWQKVHWRAIVSAYNNSPFFEYYSDNFAPFYHEKRWKYLTDYNRIFQTMVMEELGLHGNIGTTEVFCPPGEIPTDAHDYRYAIDPKPGRRTADDHFFAAIYMQVFQEKFGFTPNLSIADLLFNEGPMAIEILKKSIVP